MERIEVKNDKMMVNLYHDEPKSFFAQAKAKSEKYTVLSPDEVSPYGFNHIHSHLVGMISEHASWVLFSEIEKMLGVDLGIDAAFQDDTRDSECDLIVGGLRVEVKGIKANAWNRYGPCVSTRQLKNIERKADIVLWALYDDRTQTVTFQGWNPVSEIRAIKPVMTGDIGKEIKNYKVLDLLRPLQTLEFNK